MGPLLAPGIHVSIAVKRAVLFEEARRIMSLVLLSVALAANLSCAGGGGGGDGAAHGTTDSVRSSPANSAQRSAEEKRFYRDMAKASWSYLDAHYSPASGLVSATADWPNTTMWDIGAQLLGFYAAKELGILSSAEYKKRMSTVLGLARGTTQEVHLDGVHLSDHTVRVSAPADAAPGTKLPVPAASVPR